MSFRSAAGAYLRAAVLSPGTEPLILGDGADESTYQRFYVIPVQEYDRHRPTW